MNFAIVTDDLTVAPQITPEEVADIAAAGYKTIICNRPDNEEFVQPHFAQIQEAAEKLGLKVIYQPISGGTLNAQAAEQFAKNLEESPKPAFAYCRSGNRCITLWAVSEKYKGKDLQATAQTAANAGYNVTDALMYL